MVRFCGVLTQMRSAFLTAPFCINISNNAKDENISVRSRAIHAPLFFECPRRYELRAANGQMRFNRTFLYQHLK